MAAFLRRTWIARGCMKHAWRSKWCISKFLSKGLFFYYLLNVQTFSNFGRKETSEVFSSCPGAVVCVSWSGSSMKTSALLPNRSPARCPTPSEWENEESSSNLFTSFHGNTSLFVMQYSFAVYGKKGLRNPRCFKKFDLFPLPLTVLCLGFHENYSFNCSFSTKGEVGWVSLFLKTLWNLTCLILSLRLKYRSKEVFKIVRVCS